MLIVLCLMYSCILSVKAVVTRTFFQWGHGLLLMLRRQCNDDGMSGHVHEYDMAFFSNFFLMVIHQIIYAFHLWFPTLFIILYDSVLGTYLLIQVFLAETTFRLFIHGFDIISVHYAWSKDGHVGAQRVNLVSDWPRGNQSVLMSFHALSFHLLHFMNDDQ